MLLDTNKEVNLSIVFVVNVVFNGGLKVIFMFNDIRPLTSATQRCSGIRLVLLHQLARCLFLLPQPNYKLTINSFLTQHAYNQPDMNWLSGMLERGKRALNRLCQLPAHY
jgi:hypothetical protein